MEMQSETTAPLFVEGVIQWIVDCDEVPNILVDTEVAEVVVPTEYVKMGRSCSISPPARFVTCP